MGHFQKFLWNRINHNFYPKFSKNSLNPQTNLPNYYYIFSKFLRTLYSTELRQNFNFSTKTKTSKAHISVSSENTQSMRRIFFVTPKSTQIWHFPSNFRNFLFLFSTEPKILIFWQKTKLRRFIGPSFSKINSWWGTSFLFLATKSTQILNFP